ncbi:tryptophan synthetase alpha subunit [Scenedesmus sp. NREL 46B-D3]|nr:tryptophan synthetase alpha subunit [Scenedesmus sp. NREL 46B-D3]
MQAQLVSSRSCLRASALSRARPSRSARLNVINAAAVSTKSVSGRMAELKAQGKVAFIPFLVAGDPNLDTTAAALKKLDEVGSDVIELGVPYSDPLADGAVIHTAATRALQLGTTLDRVIDMVAKVAPELKAPWRGMDKFCEQIKAAGAAGLLVPDLPLEETVTIRAACERAGLELVLLTTPTTPKARMAEIARASQGFVYLVSVTGVTGVQEKVQARVETLVETLHAVTDKSVAVGFGVSKPEHAKQIVDWGAEGVICGSALVRALGDAATPEEGLKNMEALARSLRDAIPH